jgi:hypothetical protein
MIMTMTKTTMIMTTTKTGIKRMKRMYRRSIAAPLPQGVQ